MTQTSPSAKDVQSALMRQTLLDRELVRPVGRPVVPLLPWLHVIALGGRSIVDRGRTVLEPLAEELRSVISEHRALILTGGGIRARHVLGVGLDLGLPTGVLHGLAATEAEQNGHLVASLLATAGVSYIPHATAAHQLAAHLAGAPAVVANGYPPYGLYELPPAVGKIPPHRDDTGTFLLADAYGAARTIYVKDVDGIHTADPATAAEPPALIPRISLSELRARELKSLPIESAVLDLLERAKNVREVQIINGLTPGNLTRALKGEHVGTILHAD